MRTSFYTFLTSIVLFFACDDQNSPEIQGSENIISEVREVGAFESIHISSVINATIVTGAQDLSISANDNIIDLVITEVRDQILYIDLEEGNYGEISITAHITTPEFYELTTVGINSIQVNQFDGLDQVELNIEGVGNIEISGSANEVLVNSSGASNLEGFDFTVTNCEINLTGIGNVQITATEELSGALSGVGNILYKGTPKIDVDVTGVGNVVNSN